MLGNNGITASFKCTNNVDDTPKNPKNFIICGVIIIWICCSSMTQIANKEVLSDGNSPLILVSFQMFLGSTVHFLTWWIYRNSETIEKRISTSKVANLSGIWLLVVGLCNVSAHLLTLHAVQIITPALTHIIRGTEPIWIMGLSYMMLQNKSSVGEGISVILMILGLILIAVSQAQIHEANNTLFIKGIITTVVANFAIALRNCAYKKYSLLSSRTLYYPKMCTIALGFVVIPAIILSKGEKISMYIFPASFFHVVYSSMSFYVLSFMNPTSHSMVKLVSRTVVVLSLSLVYGYEKSGWTMIFGTLFCLLGGFFYSSPNTYEKFIKKQMLIILSMTILITCFIIVYSCGYTEQKRLTYVIRKSKTLAYIPLRPFNACNDRIKHLSCKKTVIASSSGPIRLKPNIEDNVCEHMLANSSSNNLEEANIMICLQVNNTVGGVVELLKDSSWTEPDNVRFLKGSEIDEVISAVDDKNVKIVDRVVAIIHSGYTPRSKKSSQARAKNNNRGNFIWSFGATRLMNPYTTVLVQDYDYNSQMTPPAKAYVIPTANIFDLNENDRKDKMVNVIKGLVEKFNLPTIMLGAGVQIDFSTMSVQTLSNKNVLHTSHRNLLNELQKHRKGEFSVSVRGNITETACKNAGFNNCISLGCPSLTINHSRNLGQDLKLKWDKFLGKLERGEKIKLGLTLPDKKKNNKNLISLFKKIYDSSNIVYFILQTENDREIALKIAEHSDIFMFDNVEDWMEFTSDLDIILSPRIHGGMAGIIAGTPAVIIPTDFRIMELVNAMLLPTLSLDEILTLDPGDLVTLLKSVKPDFKAFEENRIEKIASYWKILSNVGIEMDPELIVIQKNVYN